MSVLFEESFEPYRQLEVKEGVRFLKNIENDKESPDYFRGAMAMLKSIIALPAKLAGEESKDQQKQADVLRLKALDYFEVKMLRSYLDE